MNNLTRCFFICLFLLLTGCATLQQNFEPPTVSLTSFRLLPYERMTPRFEIGLHVINPNLMPLALKGISYKVNIEGHQLLNGVTNDLPLIEGYGEGDVILEASTDLFSSLRLLSELMAEPRDIFTYELEAKLDVGSMLPAIRIKETGEVHLKKYRAQ